jgi:hypothetical protein
MLSYEAEVLSLLKERERILEIVAICNAGMDYESVVDMILVDVVVVMLIKFPISLDNVAADRAQSLLRTSNNDPDRGRGYFYPPANQRR